MTENERLKGLLWFAWNEFNHIRARSGAPLDQYGERTVDIDYWEWMLNQFAEAIGPDSTRPWPSDQAFDILAVTEPL